MRMRKRAVAAVFVATAAFTALAPQAVAMPMPWETIGHPTVTAHDAPPATAADSGRATTLCGPPCYQ
ncbi:hypothetical protein [Streptomyces sp. NPDC096012]|uniref:hypothetical protein n=1 Tax=Streptomyces sp. NPDC096012 TaxID=3155684 RepID=UPI00336A886A